MSDPIHNARISRFESPAYQKTRHRPKRIYRGELDDGARSKRRIA